VGVDLYRVSLTILHPMIGAVPLMVCPEWLVMEFLHPPPSLDVLLGRDFADLCLLVLDGPRGYFTLGYSGLRRNLSLPRTTLSGRVKRPFRVGTRY
jgi:hypothetical protein